MSQSQCLLLYHVVFSTKHRRPWLTDDVRPRVHEYLGGLIAARKGIPLIIDGASEHVHLMVRLHQSYAVADVLRDLKAVSSGWVHDTFPHRQEFGWQTGNGVFTVSPSQSEKLRRYIEKQEEHHKTVSFEDEFRALLTAHGIEFNEKYLFADGDGEGDKKSRDAEEDMNGKGVGS